MDSALKRAALLSGSGDRPDLLLEFAVCVRLLVSAVRTIVLRISELRISFGLLKPDVLAPACRALRIMFDACSACYLIELIYSDIILFHCLILLYQRQSMLPSSLF